MTQLMIRRALPVFIASMLVSAPALAGAVTSSNSNHGSGDTQLFAPPRRPMLTSPFASADQTMQHRQPIGSQECISRSCKRREWLKYHPRPRYPSGEDEASWYAPGGPMACGGEYAASDMGVANKTLPCGTQLSVCYKPEQYDPKHCVKVEVMDRGPYVAGRVFDLQQAPKERLGFPGLGRVHWAVISWPSHHSRQ